MEAFKLRQTQLQRMVTKDISHGCIHPRAFPRQ
jgi:hypothetical protein